jgi:hypothetical protein
MQFTCLIGGRGFGKIFKSKEFKIKRREKSIC